MAKNDNKKLSLYHIVWATRLIFSGIVKGSMPEPPTKFGPNRSTYMLAHQLWNLKTWKFLGKFFFQIFYVLKIANKSCSELKSRSRKLVSVFRFGRYWGQESPTEIFRHFSATNRTKPRTEQRRTIPPFLLVVPVYPWGPSNARYEF